MTEPITDAERAAWQAACDAATPGPWVENMAELGERDLAWAGCGPVHEGLRSGGLTAYGDSCADAYQRAQADAAFIALARTALPRLLAALTQAEGGRDRAYREASDARTELMADMGPLIRQIKLRDVDIARLTAERDAARKEAATERDQRQRLEIAARALLYSRPDEAPGALAELRRVCEEVNQQKNAGWAYQPPLPPLPDPAAPQQLGLGGYASDHGKGRGW